MELFKEYADELVKNGSIWVTEYITGDLEMYLGMETGIDYTITYDLKHPGEKVQFSLQ